MNSYLFMQNMVIHIHKTVTNGQNYAPVVGETTKTENGTRDIVLSKNCYEVFAYYLKYIRPKIVKSSTVELLFVTNRTNETIRTSEVNTDFKRVCQKIGLQMPIIICCAIPLSRTVSTQA